MQLLYRSTWFLLSTLFFFGGTSICLAQENFSTRLETEYTVHSNSQTTITHQFTITNNTPSYYIKQYALKLSATSQVDRVTVTSNGQQLAPNVVTAQNQTSIAVNFPDQLVGEGKSRVLRVSYQTPDAAQLLGTVLEIHVPQLSLEQEYSEYRVRIKTPAVFGEPVRTSPAAIKNSQEGEYIVTEFSPKNKEAVTLFFGREQAFDLSLRYHLQNPTNSRVITQIALPPDTSFQRVWYRQINPQPDEIAADEDGNWIASYRLEPGEEAQIDVSLLAQLFLAPRPEFAVNKPNSRWLTEQEFWELTSEPLKQKAALLPSPQHIYESVIDALTYNAAILDPATIPERLGAERALTQPTLATCQEFTDLFVSLARINGIPARRVTGYAYTQNSTLRPLSLSTDILHAWPEYFDAEKNLWVSTDPTWGDTTNGVDYFSQFDLNHIVFAINGLSSTQPIPAGAYKTEVATTKDVTVQVTAPPSTYPIALSAIVKNRSILGLSIPGQYEAHIKNDSGGAWPLINFELNANSQKVIAQILDNSPSLLLPFQTIALPLTVYTTSWQPKQVELQLTVEINPVTHEQNTFTLTVYAYPWYLAEPLFLTSLGVGLTTLALITGSVLVLRRKRSSTLRR